MPHPAALVVGAGPAGVAAALVLARAGHEVLVIDRSRFPRDKTCGEGVLPSGVAALRRLALLDTVLATGAQRLHTVSYGRVLDELTVTASFPSGSPQHVDQWGLGVRRLRFDAALVEALHREPRITVGEGVRATGVLRDGGGAVSGVLTDAGPLHARITIAADGLRSTLRRTAGWTVHTERRARYGVTGHWQLATAGLRGITVSFDTDCEWYQAPVGPDEILVSALGRRSAIGRIARNYEREARSAHPALRDAVMTSGVRAAGRFNQRPERIADEGLLLTGDAAGYHDPSTGEGIGMALLTGEAAGGMAADLLHRNILTAEDSAPYVQRHADLWRDRRRLTHIAILLASRPTMCRRALRSLAQRPQVVEKLLGINCGYWGFGRLSTRDWIALAGM